MSNAIRIAAAALALAMCAAIWTGNLTHPSTVNVQQGIR